MRRSGGLLKLGVGDPPFVAFAALRASGHDPLVANTQQRIELALNTDIDDLVGCRAAEVQTFHRGLHSVGVDEKS
jgi:hypothetical protein